MAKKKLRRQKNWNERRPREKATFLCKRKMIFEECRENKPGGNHCMGKYIQMITLQTLLCPRDQWFFYSWLELAWGAGWSSGEGKQSAQTSCRLFSTLCLVQVACNCRFWIRCSVPTWPSLFQPHVYKTYPSSETSYSSQVHQQLS